ncbi:DUF1284 domain-containing protein [Romboutsia sp.]|uniref:DUF1284 domain-containing protein n=1 Tax=Romboutsia sp. TaxID=1965302 RepID=UPI003F39424F
MLKIRPHHILCMKAYIGKGYSEEFNENIKRVIAKLQDESQNIEVIFGLDYICSKCPYNDKELVCKSEEKVNKIDSKLCSYFKIEEGIYRYSDIKEKVYSHITEEILEDICGNCEWNKITNCKELILK